MKLSKILSSPWAVDGSDFREKVWKNKAKLVNQLDQELSGMAMTGESPKAAIRNIQNALNTSKSSATRLIMTEQAYFTTAAQKDAFGELEVEEYEVVGTLEGKTCGDCGDMDGAHYPVKDMQVGANAPPFHPYCRCTTVPYFEDDFESKVERAARDQDGKTYYVLSDMTYKEWQNKHVHDSVSEKTKKEYAKHQDILGDNSPTLEEFTKIRYNDGDWNMFKAYSSSVKSGELTPLADFKLYKNISKEMDDKLDGVVTSNGINISGKSNHSIARVIGSVEQKRNGVSVDNVLDAITNKNSEILPVKTLKNGKSQKFRNEAVEVSINPDTDNIIQVNPVHRKKVES